MAIILLYAAFAVVSRDGNDQAGFMLLRGNDSGADRGRGANAFVREEEEVSEREPVEHWDPVPDNDYGYRGPVKGGVEVYPLQVRLFGQGGLVCGTNNKQPSDISTRLMPHDVLLVGLVQCPGHQTPQYA